MNLGLKLTVAPDSVALRPGESTEIEVTIQNAGQAVEHYATSLVGIPDDLYECEPAVVKLRPGESGLVRVRIRLPDRAGPGDGGYVLGVLARSPYQRDVSRCEELRLEVVSAPALSVTAQPEVAVGGSTGRYAVQLRNEGNTAVTVSLHATDPQRAVECSFQPRSLQIAPGGQATAELTVRANPPWTGQEKRHVLTMRAVAGQDVEAEQPLTFVQRPRVAGGLLRLAGLGTAVAVLAGATIGAALLTRAGQDDRADPGQQPSAVASPGLAGEAGAPASSAAPGGSATPATAAVAPGTTVVVDFTQLPDGTPAGNQLIRADTYAASGVTLSTVTDRAPPACQDATALALRTGPRIGGFLTSARPAGVDLCNVLPVRARFATPVRVVRLSYLGTGVQYTMTVELTDGNTRPITGAAANGATGQLEFGAPAGVAIVSVVFGHTNPDPNAKEPTLLKRIVYTA